ncbi:MAG: AmmeMemoRadiSam system radical SAM enzyme [bacterium]|nr:AmmeMemoRadiSam system radical SAM enzyme [bacterium]
MYSRREFLSRAGRFAAVLGGAGLVVPCRRGFAASTRLDEILRTAPKARYWTSFALAGSDCAACHGTDASLRGKKHDHAPGLVKCLLCAHACVIPAGERGRCRARMNFGGELRSLVYGRPIAVHVDPIEKKPFFHFLPGAAAFSFGTAGCPLRCRFCQNWQLSQSRPEDHPTEFTPPGEMVAAAGARKAQVIAFTYNEPTVQTEFLTDVARAAKKEGIRSALVSCGFMNEALLREICGVLDAVKIDLKGFSPEFYREVSQAELAPVLRSIRQAAKSGIHLEIVNLVVPTLNDSEKMFRGLADWVAGEIGPDVPVHFTRFHPDYQLRNLPPTPVATLEKAREIAMRKGIRYAYVGNVPGHPGNHTYCPGCGKVVVGRSGFFVTAMNIEKGRCRSCRRSIAGVWA